MKKAIDPMVGTKKVDEFMDGLDHPFKAEVQTVRDIIKNVNKEITEEIKGIYLGASPEPYPPQAAGY